MTDVCERCGEMSFGDIKAGNVHIKCWTDKEWEQHIKTNYPTSLDKSKEAKT